MYWKYLKYVTLHKWYVFLECWKAGIWWEGFVHDWSKFRLSEFIPYARNFFGHYSSYDSNEVKNKSGLFKEDIKRKFDYAWLLHIHRNPHHWQFWLLQEDNGPPKNIPIPIKYLKEMICDWRGAGKSITGKDNILEWYKKNKDKINLNRINRKLVEHKIGYKENDKCVS